MRIPGERLHPTGMIEDDGDIRRDRQRARSGIQRFVVGEIEIAEHPRCGGEGHRIVVMHCKRLPRHADRDSRARLVQAALDGAE